MYLTIITEPEDIMAVFKLTKKADTPTTGEVTPEPVATEQEPEIILDGPLSHIYTQALNAVYSLEEITEDLTGEPLEDPQRTYIYCLDADNLTHNDLVKTTNRLRIALDSKRFDKVMLSMEVTGNVNSSVGLLGSFSNNLGIEVIHNRRSMLETIRKMS